MKQQARILNIDLITHDVIRITTEKPHHLTYKPGQAADVSINKPGWEKELRSFTFTSLPDDDHLEFTIKSYTSHHGVTEQLRTLRQDDELFIHDVYGDIIYKGEGMFIAGGAGVTPFIAIFKYLENKNLIGNNKLLFANKTKGDIILKEKFDLLLGNNFINILSAEKRAGYEHGYISEELIKKYSCKNTPYFYLCGPDPMMQAVEKQLSALGVQNDYIVRESF